jgi:hypothetical protein
MRKNISYGYSDEFYDCHAEVLALCPQCGSPVFRDYTLGEAGNTAMEKAIAVATCLNRDCSFGLAQLKSDGLSKEEIQFCIGTTINLNEWLPHFAKMKKTGESSCDGCPHQQIACSSCS